MLILGIDPGTATTGFGVLELNDNDLKVIDFGLIETKNIGQTQTHVRLKNIYTQMLSLLDKHKPDMLVIEKVFFSTNVKTAIAVGQAQGVIMLSAADFNLPLFEYAPGTIKKVVSGDGRSDKKMMQKHVRKILGPKVRAGARKKTHFDNAADALAIALCHIIQSGMYAHV